MIKYLVLLFILSANLFGQPSTGIQFSKIEDSVWVYTSYVLYGRDMIPSNGMLIQTSDGLILVDAPWNDTLTSILLDNVKSRFHQPVTIAFITHAHADRIGGIKTLRKNKIKTVSMAITCQKALELGYEVPLQMSSLDTTMVVGNEQVECVYLGAGHTVDNSVLWLPGRKILFGGCLVKAESAQNLGNVVDADLMEWPQTIRRIMDKFPTSRVIVPGHGYWGGFGLLQHTMDLLSAHKEE